MTINSIRSAIELSEGNLHLKVTNVQLQKSESSFARSTVKDDLLSFFLSNLTINSFVSVLNSLLLGPISFVYNLQKGSTTNVK
jgi:hypothetical protein